MSSNTSKGRGEKGSKFWMQMIPNTKLKEQFDRLIGDELRWLSPLKEEDYAEYELRSKVITDKLGVKTTKQIWPNRQPQWDGIALGERKGILYLVEAKSYPAEMNSKSKASPHSIEDIQKSLKCVHDEMKCNCKDFDRFWMGEYYQLANRLLFLRKMKGLGNYTDTRLVLLNFVNDFTHTMKGCCISQEEWEMHYAKVFEEMTGRTGIPDDVLVVYYDVAGNLVLG